MALPTRPTDPSVGRLHDDRIAQAIEGGRPDDPGKDVSGSWRRCVVEHRLEPSSRSSPNILTERELTQLREPFNAVLLHAQEEIDRLYAIVRQAGYVVLLCNAEGVALHHRGNERMADQFKRWGTWLGGVWSEQVEGTNGIGTCIVEQRPISVHCDQHFRTRHVGLSCAGAPIFDARGTLVGVLDSSSIDPQTSDHAHALTLAATITSAREIEERLFRESYRHAWVIAAIPCDESRPAVLLAVDRDQYVVGADRVARVAFDITADRLARGVPLRTVFDYDGSLLSRVAEDDAAALLARAGGDEMWSVLITPPESASSAARRLGGPSLHTRPRIAVLDRLPTLTTESRTRGGLPPRLSRRIREYIDSHLDGNISLETLASTAGLSVHHFARAFRQSVGEPPHSYLLRRRIERAQEMLKQTELPLSDIALAVGFSDHSHLARHFKRLMGITPSAARWRER